MHSKLSLSLYLKTHYQFIWWFISLLSLTPALHLYYRYYKNDLGINALETLTHQSGKWALIFLIITLSITPTRRLMAWYSRKVQSVYGKRLSDWNWIIRLRRMLGLYCFYYASLHFGIYVNYDIDWEWQFLREDIEEKNYLFIGLAAYSWLTLLALTSFNLAIRWLKSYWKKIHQLIYPIAVLVIIHFSMSVKIGNSSPIIYGFIIFMLLAYRLAAHLGLFIRISRDDGEIIAERPFQKNNTSEH